MLDRFLYHDAAERQRLLDLSMRLRRTHALTVAVMTLPLIVGVPTFGWHWAAPLIAAGVFYLAVVSRLSKVRRPELLLFANGVIAIIASLVSIWFASGPKELLFATPVFPLLTMAPIFARRVSVTAALLAGLGLVAVGLGSYGHQIAALPPMLIIPGMLGIVTVVNAMASRNAEDLNRSAAVVDPLTGLLNRAALRSRATELEQHTAASGDCIGLLIADLDHFKATNDQHGHAMGDRVLAELAGRLRSELGTAGTAFRFGGEEFVVLLHGTSVGMAVEWAERLREAVRFAPIEGLSITASFGVAVSSPSGFAYRELFARADDALYRAKAAGRDRVASAVDLAVVPDPAGARRATDVPSADAAASAIATDASGWDAARTRRDHDGNWLVGDAIERAHLVDLLERSAKDSALTSGILLVGLVISGFWLQWWYLLPPIGTISFWTICTTIVPKVRRPEFPSLVGLIAILLSSVFATLLADPTNVWNLSMGSIGVFGACAAFTQRGAFTIGLCAILATLATGFLVDANALVQAPFALVYPLSLIASSALLGEAMGRSARTHRVAGITDGLTGALNRTALEARIPQLAQHVLTSTAPTTLLVTDIDHFKRVNDELGHDAGDTVLQEVVGRLRGSLRASDLIYRVGGEEFVVVLTDTDAPDALAVAERLRVAVGSVPLAGTPVTISIGLATAPAGRRLDYDATFAIADARLYAAKSAGRDRVVNTDVTPAALELAQAA